MNKKRKVKWKKIVYIFILFCLSIVFIFFLFKVIFKIRDRINTNNLIEDIDSLVVIKDNNDIGNFIEVDDESDVEENINYYYEYLKIPFMSVDLSRLKEINNDVSGWINVSGAGVNYPYLQTTNNEYYLKYSFDKTKNDSGWVFLDYRNQNTELDKNNIIYAHGGDIFTMFGPLKKLYDNDEWFKNDSNHYIRISNEKYNYVFKVFSLYVIKTTSDYLKIDFSNDSSYQEFLDKIKNRSYYDFNTKISSDDKIITLSTCYNKKEKLVLHGKLIKTQEN